MKLVATVEDDDPDAVCAEFRYFMEGVVGINRRILRANKQIPPVYASGIRYRAEPWAEEVQQLANISQVIAAGFGDCKHLCCWRKAELLEQHPDLQFGFRFTLHTITRRSTPDQLHAARGRAAEVYCIYHVAIELPPGFGDNPIEDVSRFLHQ